MAQTLGNSGIFFDELEDSPFLDGNISQRNFSVTQKGLGNWGDINAMVSYLLSPTLLYGTLFGVSAGAAYPGNTLLRCVDFKIVPADMIIGADANGINLHNFCFWTIKYQNILAQPNQNQTQDPVPMLTHEWDVGGEFIVVKPNSLQWANDSTSAGGDVRGGIFIPTQEISISWPRLPNSGAPFTSIRALAGKVNNADIPFDTGVMKFETALFLGAKVRRDTMSDGTLAWTMTYKFSQKQVPAADSGKNYGGSIGTQSAIGGWNHYYRSDSATPGFYRLQLTQSVAGSQSIYQRGNFNLLFQIDQATSEDGT